MFHNLLALVPVCQDRSGTILNGSGLFLVHRYTWILLFYKFCDYVTILYWLCFFILTYGQCCHVAETLFSALGRLNWKQKTIAAHFRSTHCKWREDVRIEPCLACGSGKLPFQHVLLPFGAAGGLMSRACSYYLRVWCEVAGGSICRVPACLITSQTLLRDDFPNIVSKICNIGSEMDFNDFGVWQKPLYKEATGRSNLFFLFCERNHIFLTSHRLPWNQFSHATPKILQLIHLFSYTIRILLQGFMAMSCTRISHYFLLPNYFAHHLTLSTETTSDFLLNVSARWHCLGFHYIF